MRICHVSPHLPPDQAANALLPAQLGAWQRARGDDVRFVTHEAAQSTTESADRDAGITRLKRRRTSGLSRALRTDAFVMVRAVARALDAAPIDLLHLHSNGLIVEAAARWARRAHVPHVLTLYGTEIWHYQPRWPVDLFTRAYRAADVVTFYSRRLQDRAVELGLGRDGLVTIYPPVDARFAAADDDQRSAWRGALGIRESQIVLNVKRLHPLAAQDVLLDAFARVGGRDRSDRHDDDVRLVICGTGALRASLEDRARGLGIADRVTFTGLVPNDTIARYAAVADVFALPSQLEALPTVAVEALACGTPVVSADHPGGLELHEIFGDDVRIVARGDAAGLAAAIVDHLRTPRRVSAGTLASVERLFRPAAVLGAYDAAYERARGAGQ